MGEVMTREAHPRMKGVELYSWRVESNGWYFALLDGTNHEKSYNEVAVGPGRFGSVAELVAGMSGLAVGESLVWRGFDAPLPADVAAIEQACRSLSLRLHR